MQKAVLFAQWYKQTNPGGNLNSVFFTTKDTGYAVGNGTIIKTTNGGVNWTLQTSGTTTNLTSVYFTDSKTGYVVGWGIILKTVDGGNTWTRTATQYSIGQCTSVFFPNKNNGYVLTGGGGDHYNFKTIDAGNTWDTLPYPKQDGLGGLGFSVFFTDNLTGYVVGENIWKTTDGGVLWVSQSGTGASSVYFPSKDTGYVVPGFGFTSIKTSNAGADWIMDTCKNAYSLFSVHFTNDTIGYAVGATTINPAPGIIIMTSDGGNTWYPQKTDSIPANFTSVCFPTTNIGYAVGAMIFKTTNAGGPVIKDTTVIDGVYNIIQNKSIQTYPNPASNYLNIDKQLSLSQDIECDIYDILGKQVLKRLKCNDQITQIDIGGLREGIYVIKIYAENNVYSEIKFVKEN
jgi:photosystem II stability/assembly factor-like uncharacterized protein